MFHGDLATTLQLKPMFLRINACYFLSLGHISLMPRVSDRRNLAMLCPIVNVTTCLMSVSNFIVTSYHCKFFSGGLHVTLNRGKGS